MASCTVKSLGWYGGNGPYNGWWDNEDPAKGNNIFIAFKTPSSADNYNNINISITDGNSIASGSKTMYAYLIDYDLYSLSTSPSNYISSSTITYNSNSVTEFTMNASGLSPNTSYIIILISSGYYNAFADYPLTVYKSNISISAEAGSGAGSTVSTYTINYYSDGVTFISSDYISPNDTYTIRAGLTTPPEEAEVDTSNFIITGDMNDEIHDNIQITAVKTVTTQYIFKGWELGSDIIYQPGDVVQASILFANYPLGTISLVAKWEEEEGVIYENNTIADLGTVSRNNDTVPHTITLVDTMDSTSEVIETNTVISYKFKGWSSTKDGSVILSSKVSYTKDTTVFAVWETTTNNQIINLPTLDKDYSEISETYKVTLVALDPTTNTSSTTEVESNKILDYKFIGWSKTNNQNNYSTVNTRYTVSEDTTLYGMWQSYYTTESIELPMPVEVEGYRFRGWTTDNDSNFVSSPYTPIESITLYAKYKIGKDIKAFIYHNDKWYRIMI